jgi:hypothetical protein
MDVAGVGREGRRQFKVRVRTGLYVRHFWFIGLFRIGFWRFRFRFGLFWYIGMNLDRDLYRRGVYQGSEDKKE